MNEFRVGSLIFADVGLSPSDNVSGLSDKLIREYRTDTAPGSTEPDGSGAWHAPEFPIFHDWVMVLDRRG